MLSFCQLFLCLINLSAVSTGKNVLLISTIHAANSTPRVASVSVPRDSGEEINFESLGYGCQTYYEGFGPKRTKRILQLEIKSMSYDEGSKKLLIQTTTRDENRFTLLIGDPCKSQLRESSCQDLKEDRGFLREVFGDFENSEENWKDAHSLKTLYREAKSPDSSRVGPFAIFQGRIFFVLQRLQTSDFKSKTNLVQIRELLFKCFDTNLEYPVFATDSLFDLMECSLLIAEVVQETFVHFHRFRPLDVLLVIPNKHGLDFFLQILEIFTYPANSSASENVKTIAHLYRASNFGSSVEVIHSTNMVSNYVKYFLLQLGGISYKEDFLCWAPLDRIVCGLWSGSKMSRLRTHLQPTEARHVCTASINNPGLSHIISGLAISSATIGGEISLHFGCVAQVPGIGGFGFLRTSEKGGSPVQLARINYSDVPVSAGSLILTDGCEDASSNAAIFLPISWTLICACFVSVR